MVSNYDKRGQMSKSNNILLALGLPAGTLAGIDTISFSTPTSPPFYGIRNIESGIHLFFTGARLTLSSRQAVWLDVPSSGSATFARDAADRQAGRGWRVMGGPLGDAQVYSLRWDEQSETMIEASDEDVKAWVDGAPPGVWSSGLVEYEKIANPAIKEVGDDRIADWKQVTGFITPSLLDRMFRYNEDAQERQNQPRWTINTGSSAAQDIETIPDLKPDDGDTDTIKQESTTADQQDDGQMEADLGFLSINLKQTWRPGAVGRERTDGARDRSWLLAETAKTDSPSSIATRRRLYRGILGEMQVAFVAVVVVNNISCLFQWRRLVELVLTSTRAVVEGGADGSNPAIAVLRLMRFQLAMSDQVSGGSGPKAGSDDTAGLFDLSEDGASFLRSQLVSFRARIEDERAGQDEQTVDKVLRELGRLEQYLTTRHGWTVFPAADSSTDAAGSQRERKLESRTAFVRTGMVMLEDGDEVELDDVDRDELDEQGEWAPAVVDLTADQAAIVGIEPWQAPGRRLDEILREELEDEDGDADQAE